MDIYLKTWAYDLIKRGKRLELRRNQYPFDRIKANQLVTFHRGNTGTKIRVLITRRTEYSTLEEVIEHENLNKLAPGWDRDGIKRLAPRIVGTRDLVIFEFETIN